ncbi:MAG: SPOR domain-containing protein, partial [Betaproteobacteria bacterium]|nr:SPOR domain-containing protein [Betaproteobacteria bacterium]
MKLPGKRAKDGTRGGGSAAQQAQSEEVLRVRARRRLIGAVALVLTGVVVFPLIFETQPKPVASNIALVIPPQDQASSVARPAPATAPSAAAAVAAPGSAAGAQPQVQPQPQPQAQAQVPPHPPQVQVPAQAPAKAQARAPEQAPPPQRDVAA